MKKITKILALTLALITLALSCTSCGNLFISDEEKQEMAWDIENYSTVEWYHITTNDKAKIVGAGQSYVKDKPLNIKCITYYDEMIVTFTVNHFIGSLHNYKNNMPWENILEFQLPYKIKSVESTSAADTVISKDRKTVTLKYSHEGKELWGANKIYYDINDQITIKYKK